MTNRADSLHVSLILFLAAAMLSVFWFTGVFAAQDSSKHAQAVELPKPVDKVTLNEQERQVILIYQQQVLIESKTIEAAQARAQLAQDRLNAALNKAVADRKLEGEWTISQDLSTLILKPKAEAAIKAAK